ncbi:MAG: PQQ-binding-like beta-propeller repeat protein [Verrucomicrobiales bacterium]|nr:PQQ-binding-like beta-propeller repeat protein [Verrucomicrobiales bacterium]
MKTTIAALVALFTLATTLTANDRLVIGAEGKRSVAIVDPSDGNKVLWQHNLSGPVHNLHLLPNLNLLTQDGWKNIIEIDLTEGIVWNYDAAESNRTKANTPDKFEVHAVQRLDKGKTMIVESGSSRIIEVGAKGKLLKELPLQVSEPNGHSDTRQVHKLDNGHYLVAHEADQVVKEYDADGKVVWEFPIPLFGKEPARGHGPEGFGGRCFNAIKAKNGNYLIATGNGHSVLEVTPEKEIIWKLEQNDLEGITLAWVTTLQELDNGNLIIGNCHAGPDNPQIIEITRDKKVVWSFNDFETFGNALAVSLVVDGDTAKAIRAKLAASK